MSKETNVTNAFIATTTGGGLIATVNEYSAIISLTIAATGLLIGLFFHILTARHRIKIEKKNSIEYKEKIRKEIISEFNIK